MFRNVRTFADLVKWEHTIFALPFAYAGAFLAARGLPHWSVLGWITLAMFGGRTSAMAFNRLIDRVVDAKNPRTAGRPLPQGKISPVMVLVYALLATGLLVFAAARLNPLAVAFLPVVVPVLVLYSYMKRWTWLCHFWLGLSYFFVPFGGWVAVTGRLSLPPVVLGLAAGLWVAGFDLIYACQDYEFDKREGVLSVPARFGLATALTLARYVHFVTTLLLLWAGLLLGLGWIYWLGMALVAALLIYEHLLVSPRDLSRLDAAFFNVNGYISILYFIVAALAALRLKA
ncbi:MAG: UbiA-like polyprenyltransferase [Symbiobacteriia bacterium]